MGKGAQLKSNQVNTITQNTVDETKEYEEKNSKDFVLSMLKIELLVLRMNRISTLVPGEFVIYDQTKILRHSVATSISSPLILDKVGDDDKSVAGKSVNSERPKKKKKKERKPRQEKKKIYEVTRKQG